MPGWLATYLPMPKQSSWKLWGWEVAGLNMINHPRLKVYQNHPKSQSKPPYQNHPKTQSKVVLKEVRSLIKELFSSGNVVHQHTRLHPYGCFPRHSLDRIKQTWHTYQNWHIPGQMDSLNYLSIKKLKDHHSHWIYFIINLFVSSEVAGYVCFLGDYQTSAFLMSNF